MQSSASKKTAQINAQSVRDTNALNYQQFLESRGSGGNAILPMYMPEGTERRLADDAVQVYDTITGQPATMTLAQYQAYVDAAQPVIDQGNRLVASIYSGDLERQRLAALDPVLAARTAGAETQAAASDLAMRESLNQIGAEQARRGFVGQSGFTQNQMLQASISARQNAAMARAQAAYQNAGDTRGVNNEMLALQLQSLNEPFNRAQQQIQLQQMPAQGLANQQAIAQQGLNFWRLNPGNPPQAQSPQLQQTANTGAVVASGIGQVGSAYANYLAQQQLQQQQLEALWQMQQAQNQANMYQPATGYANSGSGGSGSYSGAIPNYGSG